MPFAPDDASQIGFRGPDEATPAPPDASSVIGAAARLYNPIVSTLNYLSDHSAANPPDPSYDPLTDVRGTKYESNYLDRFVTTRSHADTLAIMHEIDQEEQDHRVLSAAGWPGTVASVGMGLLDPTLAIPAGALYRTAKGGYDIARIALSGAAAGALQSTISEGALYATQETKTPGEVVQNVGIATVLSGLIGAGAGALLSRGERKALETSLQADREAWTADLQPSPNLPGSIAGAAATDTRTLEPVGSFGVAEFFNKVPGVKSVLGSPVGRTLMKPFVTARRAMVDLAEPVWRFKENLEGVATTQGPAASRLIDMEINRGRVLMANTLDQLYARYRFGWTDVSWTKQQVGKAVALADRARGASPDLMTPTEFREAVGRSMRQGDQSPVPEIAEAAQTVRAKVFEPWKNRAIDAGLLPADVAPETALSYFSRVYNREKITARRPEFTKTVTDWLGTEQNKKAALQGKLGTDWEALHQAQAQGRKIEGRIATTQGRIQQTETRLSERGMETIAAGTRRDTLDARQAELLAAARDNARAQEEAARSRIEATLAQWEGKSAKAAQGALKARGEAERLRGLKQEAGAYQGQGGRLTSADSEVASAVRRVLESDRGLSRQELEARAGEIVDRILSTPDGRLPYDAPNGGPVQGAPGGPRPRGPLAAREFMIPDSLIEPFLENDVGEVGNRYLHTMVRDVTLTDKFGDVEMTGAFKGLREEHEKLAGAAKSEKERTKLRKDYEEAVSDLAGVRDRVRGVYGWSDKPGERSWGRMAHGLKQWSFLTSMGMVVLSSLNDAAGPVFRFGLTAPLKAAWIPFARRVLHVDGSAPIYRQWREQFRALGLASETVLGTRIHAWGDLNGQYKPSSRFERTLDAGADTFAIATGITLWTDTMKTIAGMTASHQFGKALEASVAGKITREQTAQLAEAGIDAQMASRIWNEMSKPGGSDVIDGVRLPNTDKWTDRGAREAFEGALARDMDIAIVTPGQERPLWLSRPTASMIGQFKSFIAAANDRMLIANLQRADFNTLQGVIFSIGLGMLSAKATAIAAGRPEPQNPEDWLKEGIDRSGILGWFGEMNAVASKLSADQMDIFRIIGADKPLSRYQTRSALAALLGPTAGKLQSLADIGSTMSPKIDWTEADTRRMRRLIPMQNLAYLSRLFDELEKSANTAFGVKMH